MKLDDLKLLYDNIEVSDKLDETIQQTIDSKINRRVIMMENKNNNTKKIIKTVGAIAASFVVVVSVGANVNASTAKALYNVPVIGQLAKVVTFRDYNFENDASKGKVIVPEIKDVKKNVEEKINNIIKTKVDEMVKEQEKLDKEYKEAYLETGGKEEDYTKVETEVNYKKGYSDDKYVSFEIYKTQTLAPAYNENFYYTFDIESGKQLTLKDIMGEDFATTVKDKVTEEMKARMKKENNDKMYDLKEFEGYEINNDRTFYIDKDGNIVVTFAKYEVASGSMGVQEFKVGSIK